MLENVRHPQSRMPLRGVRRLDVDEMLEPADRQSKPDGTWCNCPPDRVGTRVEQNEHEHDYKVVWVRPVEAPATALNARLGTVEARMGSMHRLW